MMRMDPAGRDVVRFAAKWIGRGVKWVLRLAYAAATRMAAAAGASSLLLIAQQFLQPLEALA